MIPLQGIPLLRTCSESSFLQKDLEKMDTEPGSDNKCKFYENTNFPLLSYVHVPNLDIFLALETIPLDGT